MHVSTRSFIIAEAKLRALMLDVGQNVHTETWQGQDIRREASGAMRELLNVTVDVALRDIESLDHWRAEIRPHSPWADDHFAERVSGQPLNPPPSWAWWPWAKSADKFRADQQFNHTYPERFWPKFANGGVLPRAGIRYQYGDLDDVIELLCREPHTRQAYLPIFFPEDTGVGDGGRKPCTLGYQFIMRGGSLHCFYPMRSCDLIRHMRDDMYLAVRLMLHVLDRCRVRATNWPWVEVKPAKLVMHMTSLHCFVNDVITLQQERDAAIMGGLS